MTKTKKLEKNITEFDEKNISAGRNNPDDNPEINEGQDKDSELHADKALQESKLPWLVHNFDGIAHSIYEAIMIASTRARQIGRKQKQEIDLWYKSHEPVDGAGEEEESVPGVDHFLHPKPTVKALEELTREKLKHHYLEQEEK